MPATTWNSGGEAGHDTGDASPHLSMMMLSGSGKPNRTTPGAKERTTWSFCQDVPNHLCFNLVLYSNSQFLKLVITKMFC